MGKKAPTPRGSSSIRELAERKLACGGRTDLAKLTPDEVRNLAQELDVHRVELNSRASSPNATRTRGTSGDARSQGAEGSRASSSSSSAGMEGR